MPQSLNSWLIQVLDLPAMVFIVLLLLGGWIMWRTQSNPDNGFDFADMLRDDGGKPSVFRLGAIVAMATSTWMMMYSMVHSADKAIDIQAFGIFLGVWSGAKIADRILDYLLVRAGVRVQVAVPPMPLSDPDKNRAAAREQTSAG